MWHVRVGICGICGNAWHVECAVVSCAVALLLRNLWCVVGMEFRASAMGWS
jgi:hypothetical protein